MGEDLKPVLPPQYYPRGYGTKLDPLIFPGDISGFSEMFALTNVKSDEVNNASGHTMFEGLEGDYQVRPADGFVFVHSKNAAILSRFLAWYDAKKGEGSYHQGEREFWKEMGRRQQPSQIVLDGKVAVLAGELDGNLGILERVLNETE